MESLGINASYLLLQIGCVIVPVAVAIGTAFADQKSQAQKIGQCL